MAERLFKTLKSGILYEPSLLEKSEQPAGDLLFEPLHWMAMQTASEAAGGRGKVIFIRGANYRWVLRHYRRGGLIRNISDDRYVWWGEDRTRSFVEWRLLARLCAQGLPVPSPVAARYTRYGRVYTADLITTELPDSQSLAQTLIERALPPPQWQSVGATLARFHQAGAHHADLNAHNILLDAAGGVFVLDFDRGRLQAPGNWSSKVLERLLRSLRKLHSQHARFHFDQPDWQALMAGYERQLKAGGANNCRSG